MKERPILFQGAMVRALLAGTKTQTRRAIKLPHMNPLGKWEPFAWGGHDGGKTRDGQTVPLQQTIGHSRTGEIIGCPYGQPGDRLWVREGYSGSFALTGIPPRDWMPGVPIWYWADGNPQEGDWTKPKSGMHMPRIASRLTLEITDARVERLQDISEADALAEGIVQLRGGGYGLADTTHYHYTDPRNSYWSLWESINGAGSVEANPWTWAVSFKRIEGAKP